MCLFTGTCPPSATASNPLRRVVLLLPAGDVRSLIASSATDYVSSKYKCALADASDPGEVSDLLRSNCSPFWH
jgi:hypothetical protein